MARIDYSGLKQRIVVSKTFFDLLRAAHAGGLHPDQRVTDIVEVALTADMDALTADSTIPVGNTVAYRTNLWLSNRGDGCYSLVFFVGDTACAVSIPRPAARGGLWGVNGRNEALGLADPQCEVDPPQEVEVAERPEGVRRAGGGARLDAFMTTEEAQAASYSVGGNNWSRGAGGEYEVAHDNYHLSVELPYEKRLMLGNALDDFMLPFVKNRDADDALMFHLIVNQLVAQTGMDGLPARWQAARGYIDLADVAAAVFPRYGRDGAEVDAKMRRRVYELLHFVENMKIRGNRSTVYYEGRGKSKKPISTEFVGGVWVLGNEEKERLPNGDLASDPLRVEVIMTQEWAKTLSRQLRQYVPDTGVILKIPGRQPPGALARAMAHHLLILWRKGWLKPGEAWQTGITREEFFTKLAPAGFDVAHCVETRKWNRLYQAWRVALDHLAAAGLIDRATVKEAGKEPVGYGGHEWGGRWYKAKVNLPPAPEWARKCYQPVEAAPLADDPAPKPRAKMGRPARQAVTPAAPKRPRGRPRKNPPPQG